MAQPTPNFEVFKGKPRRRSSPPELRVEWEEPPPKRTGKDGGFVHLVEPLLAELRERPGEWARIAVWSGRSSADSAVKRCKAANLITEFEFAARRPGHAGSVLYARYIGGAAS